MLGYPKKLSIIEYVKENVNIREFPCFLHSKLNKETKHIPFYPSTQLSPYIFAKKLHRKKKAK